MAKKKSSCVTIHLSRGKDGRFKGKCGPTTETGRSTRKKRPGARTAKRVLGTGRKMAPVVVKPPRARR